MSATATGIPLPSGVKDIRGLVFGRWTVIEYAGVNKHRSAQWRCVCSCPNKTEKIICSVPLRNGKSKSCGCLYIETRQSSATTHGGCYDLEYQPWKAMNARCYDKDNISYPEYGGAGVSVQETWRRPHYDQFKKDVPPRPSKDHTLDRFPNKSGNYEIGNVRWATRSQQQQNMKSNVMLTLGNETYCMDEWSRRKGWHRSKIKNRKYAGWSDERILTTP